MKWYKLTPYKLNGKQPKKSKFKPPRNYHERYTMGISEVRCKVSFKLKLNQAVVNALRFFSFIFYFYYLFLYKTVQLFNSKVNRSEENHEIDIFISILDMIVIK